MLAKRIDKTTEYEARIDADPTHKYMKMHLNLRKDSDPMNCRSDVVAEIE